MARRDKVNRDSRDWFAVRYVGVEVMLALIQEQYHLQRPCIQQSRET